MLKVLIWIVSNDSRFFQGAMSILERQHNGLEVIGVTANEEIGLVKDGRNVPFIPLARLTGGGFDIILVVGARQFGMSQITQAARQLNLPEEKLLGDWIVCIPGFTLEKYRRLQRSRLSIFSSFCFGGFISNMLGLQFRSPFINLAIGEQEYIKLLRAPRIYMEEQFYFKKTGFERNLKRDFPIVTLGNVDISMNHDTDFNEAVEKWNRRKTRINWYNLFVTMATESEEILEEFDALPYGKKVCFVPFKSDLDSAWYINPEIHKGLPFWDVVNHFCFGNPFYYDPFDMLIYGKKTPLIDM